MSSLFLLISPAYFIKCPLSEKFGIKIAIVLRDPSQQFPRPLLVILIKMLIISANSLASVEADIWDGVHGQGEQMPGESPHGRITSQVPPHLVDHMDGLDAEHEAFVADEFVQFRGDDTFQPFRIEKRLAELYDRVYRLFADHVDRVDDHGKQSWLNLCLECLSVNKLGQFGEELHGSQADAPCLVLSQVN